MSGQWESLFGKFCHVLNDLTMNLEVIIINLYGNLKYLIYKILFIYERYLCIDEIKDKNEKYTVDSAIKLSKKSILRHMVFTETTRQRGN